MDWKRFVEFALLGSSGLEQYAIPLVRVSLGLFFAISGANKLFVAGRTQTMYERRSPLSGCLGILSGILRCLRSECPQTPSWPSSATCSGRSHQGVKPESKEKTYQRRPATSA